MTDKTDSKEREAFEAWIVTVLPSVDLTREGDGYYKSLADEWWDAFNAGRASVHIDLEDMATASSQGFRDGAASLAANAGSEPVAWVDERALSWLANSRSLSATITTKLERGKSFERPMPLYTHPSPPEGMVMVPLKATNSITCAIENEVDSQLVASAMDPRLMHRQDGSDVWDAAIAAVIAPPTSSADSRKGE